MKRIKPFVLEGGKTISVNRKDRKRLDCKIFTVLRYLFINYGPQSQFRFLIGTHLSLDLSIFALVAYFAIVPFL